ncbi:MAG: 5-methyltetrahydropteroyltriglutamate--homocysteine methyltransferase, partial [Pseudomonadota bacterium]
MTIKTTCIGAYPKPSYVKLPDWFNDPSGPDTADPTGGWESAMDAMGEDAQLLIDRGIQEAINDQVYAGIDIPTEGEIVRENYIHYHCRHLNGFDFVNLTNKEVRGGTYAANLPTINGSVSVKSLFLAGEWQKAQSMSDRPVKITMPGPMTVSDTNVDSFYGDSKKLGHDIALALNQEVVALAQAGCKHI